MKLMNEVLSGIRVIKMYAWEKPFDGFLEAARGKELGTIKRMQYISAGVHSCPATSANTPANELN